MFGHLGDLHMMFYKVASRDAACNLDTLYNISRVADRCTSLLYDLTNGRLHYNRLRE